MTLRSTIQDFFIWWLDEIKSLVPALLVTPRQMFDLRVSFENGQVCYELASEHDRQRNNIFGKSLTDLETILRNKSRRGKKPLRIFFKPGRFAERNLTDVRLPLSRAVSAAYLDMQANTPFSPQNAELGIAKSAPGTYFILKGEEIRNIEQFSKRAGLQIHSIYVDQDNEQHRIAHRIINGKRVADAAHRLRNWVTMSFLAILAIGIVGIVFLEQGRLRTASRELASRIEISRDEARELRIIHDANLKLLDQMAAIRAEKRLTNSTIHIWEELSRVLPDDTWLSDLEIKNGRLTVTGYSKSAAALVPLLDSTELFQKPGFQSAIVRSPGLDAEKFTLQAEISQQMNL